MVLQRSEEWASHQSVIGRCSSSRCPAKTFYNPISPTPPAPAAAAVTDAAAAPPPVTVVSAGVTVSCVLVLML